METDIELIPSLLGDFKSNQINPGRNQFLMDTIFVFSKEIFTWYVNGGDWRLLTESVRKISNDIIVAHKKFPQFLRTNKKDLIFFDFNFCKSFLFLKWLKWLCLSLSSPGGDCCDPSTQVSAMKYCDGGCTHSRLLIGHMTQILASDWLREALL